MTPMKLKATKTSMYKLVSEYAQLPLMKHVEYRKHTRRNGYDMQWNCSLTGYEQKAVFIICGGAIMLIIESEDERKVHRPEVESLIALGLLIPTSPIAA